MGSIVRFSAVSVVDNYAPSSMRDKALAIAAQIDQIVSGTDAASAAKRISLIAFAIRIMSAAIAFLSQILLARLMGVYEYGIFAFVWVAVMIVGSLCSFGLHTIVIRFLPEYRESNQWRLLQGLLISTRLFTLFTAIVFSIASGFLLYFFGGHIELHYVIPLWVGIFAMPMIAVGDMMDGTARANGWAIRALSPTYIIRPILLFAFMLIAWKLDYTLDAVTALVCAVIATYVTSLGQLMLVTRDLKREFPAAKPKAKLRMWLTIALPLFLVEGFFFILINADVLMVGAYMSPDDVAIYYATVKTLALVHFVYFAVKAGVSHHFASHINNPDKRELHFIARQSVTWTFWPSLGMGIFLLAVGPWLLAGFGPEFTQGYHLLFILVAGVVLRAAVGPAESLLNMTGEQNICALIYGGALVVNVVLNAVLIAYIGLYGAALATTLATIFETVFLFYVVRRRLGVSMSILSPFPPQRA